MDDEFDVLIIGAGQAGPPLARALADSGRQVALAEARHLGGSCINFGCTPTKAVLASARLLHMMRRASEFGMRCGEIAVDFVAVLERARAIVEDSRRHLAEGLGAVHGLALIEGHARIVGRQGDRYLAEIGERRLSVREIVLDTGTRSRMPPIEGLERVATLCAENWLDGAERPDRLLMIGGGYIGLEMAQFYRRMGSEVVITDPSDRIAGREEPEIAEAMEQFLKREGIEFKLGEHVKSLRADASGIVAETVAKGREPAEARYSHVFVATGRQPNTDRLGLDTVGVDLDEKGYVRVDERLATSAPGIRACGDIRGNGMFTHTAWDDYRILSSQMIGDRSRTLDRLVPYAVFTDPELGRVGMTEQQARDAGIDVVVGRFEMKENGRAREEGLTEGLIKIVAERGTRRIVGASLLCAQGGELVHLLIDVMTAGAPYTAIADAVHIHPTLAEAVQSAVAAIG